MANQTRTSRKVLAIGAHDDDVFIGVVGTILVRHYGDEIRLLVMTNGQNSHAVVLGINENPTPEYVAEARRHELENAWDDLRSCLDTSSSKLIQWDCPDTCGALTAARIEVERKLKRLLTRFEPDIIYFQAPDAHEDHRLAHHAVAAVLRKLSFHGEAYTYAIWTKDLALMRPEVDASLIEKLSGEVEVVDVRDGLEIKKHALHRFTSQVQLWPYPEWQPQEKPILDAGFLNHFLRGEEIISRFK